MAAVKILHAAALAVFGCAGRCRAYRGDCRCRPHGPPGEGVL